jgi:hypothetical protein
LGIGDWAQSPIPNPQSPIPNPQSPFFIYLSSLFKLKNLVFQKIIKNIKFINKMADSNNILKSSNIEEENKLKAAYLFLTNEYNNLKKEKLNSLYEEIKLAKKDFHFHIKEYQKDVDLTLEKEMEIEQLFSKISKTKKKSELIMNNSFNNKIYKHLLEMIGNSEKENILKNYFSLILLQENIEGKSIKDLLEILKDKEEIKSLIYYASKIYSDIRANNEKEFLKLKMKYEKFLSEINESEKGQYPFDALFECLNIIFETIEFENKIKMNNEILAKLTEKKNAKFVEIKILELKIKNLNKSIKIVQNNLKILRSFCDKFNEQKSINSEQGIKELLNNIEEYQKQEKEYQKVAPPGDVITSLTFGTYYTQSEESSVKSSKFSSKNNFALINNIPNNNASNNLDSRKKNISAFNTNDIMLKSISNCNSNIETNDRNTKKNIEEKPKIAEKYDKNNFHTNKNSDKKNNNKNKNLNNDNLYKDNIKLKQKENNIIKCNNKTYDSKYIENITKNKFMKIEKKLTSDKISSKINEKSNNSKQSTINSIKNRIKNEEKKPQNENKENLKISNNQIKEEKELVSEKKVPYNFTDLNNLGSRMNRLKHREPDESVEMSMPRENINKIETVNNENLINDNSVCDEMVSMNYDIPNNNGKNNDYINKIGVKNNLVISKELYKNKLLTRRNNNNGKLQIEKSVEVSTCCVSCT